VKVLQWFRRVHAVLALQRAGYEAIVLDNLAYGHREIVEEVLKAELIVGDTSDRVLLDSIFTTHPIAAVMHFAAFAFVGESVKDPAKYYHNNVLGTLTLLEAMLVAKIDKFVFSSTCATYGVPETIPIPENHPQNPINPYGMTKLMVEQILSDFDAAYDFRSVRFRYFNAAGADPTGQLGEDHNPETHLIPLVLLTALGKRESISIFGTDYPTPDGTCIRDYIHVSDLASAHDDQTLNSLEEYILVNSKNQRVEILTRQEQGWWKFKTYNSEQEMFCLQSLDIKSLRTTSVKTAIFFVVSRLHQRPISKILYDFNVSFADRVGDVGVWDCQLVTCPAGLSCT